MNISTWKSIGGLNKILSSCTNYFVSSKLLPKKVSKEVILKSNDSELNNCAIVIQGPLWINNNYTYETVKLYNNIFKGLTVVVSTWEGEDKKTIEELKKLDCVVVINERLYDGGIKNINNQIVTSLEGLQKVKEMGKKYVLKSRADQRIYYPDTFLFLKSLLKIFPCTSKMYKGEERVVVIDNYTNSEDGLKPFWVPDYFYFGQTEEIIRIFDVPFKNKKDYENVFDGSVKYQQLFDMNVIPELYFMKTYLSKYYDNNQIVCDDLDMWNKCKAEVLIMISPWDVDLYWIKPRQRVFQPTSLMYNNKKYFQAANQNLMNWIINYQRFQI